jgi:hypothetical protein
MVCEKCGYQESLGKEKNSNGIKLCSICFHFLPENLEKIQDYIQEKIDWKNLESFRKYGQEIGSKLKKGMSAKAQTGMLMARPPLGYSVLNGKLKPNEEAAKVHSLFTTFLQKDYSLNSLAKNYSLSVNGIKKILSNRTYLGEIKFAGKLSKGDHESIISPEIFYAVQRKLKDI